MESIDIIDPNFSLTNNINLSNDNMDLYSNEYLWLWVGVLVFALLSGLIFYKFYYNKKENTENQLDCSTEFCNMNNQA